MSAETSPTFKTVKPRTPPKMGTKALFSRAVIGQYASNFGNRLGTRSPPLGYLGSHWFLLAVPLGSEKVVFYAKNPKREMAGQATFYKWKVYCLFAYLRNSVLVDVYFGVLPCFCLCFCLLSHFFRLWSWLWCRFCSAFVVCVFSFVLLHCFIILCDACVSDFCFSFFCGVCVCVCVC